MRKPVVGVMGGSKASEEVVDLALELGRRIAEQGWILLNGGRDKGVMAASARGAQEAGGFVVGVLPNKSTAKSTPYLDLAIRTGMNDARNVINVLSSDVVIALQGELGTRSEVDFALMNKKRVIQLRFDMGDSYDKYQTSGRLSYADNPQEAIRQATEALAELGL